MAELAKLFQSGGSQAVRLPKAYRFEGQDEVLIYRNGSSSNPSGAPGSREFLELAGSARDFPYPPCHKRIVHPKMGESAFDSRAAPLQSIVKLPSDDSNLWPGVAICLKNTAV
jgi:virulence-associated protein VagC